MKATAYIQVAPTRDRYGQVKSLRIARLTKGIPDSPVRGSLVMRIEVDVHPEVFAIPTAHLEVNGDPASLASLVIPVAIVDDDDDEEEEDG